MIVKVSIGKFYFNICLFSFDEDESMDVDQEDASTSPPDFTCLECNKSFADLLKLQRHQLKKHKISGDVLHNSPSLYTFACPQCDKKYRSQGGFDQHIRTHFRMPFQCSACGKAFQTRFDRANHERTSCLRLFNVARDLYQCLSCHGVFPSIADLQSHRDVVHRAVGSEYPHDCNVCEKRFKNPHELLDHLEGHEGKNFKCGKCTQAYSSLKLLKLHYRVHGEKSLICAICGQKLSRGDKLAEHMWTHNGFPCNFCNEILPSRIAWKNHRKGHVAGG